MTARNWPHVNAKRFLAVLLATLVFCLLVGVQVQRVSPRGPKDLFSQILPWCQFGITALVALVFLAVGALVWLYARDRRVAHVLFGFCLVMMLTFAVLSGDSGGAVGLPSLFDTISSASTALSVPLLATLLLLFPRSYFPAVPGQRSVAYLLLRGYLGCLGGVCLLLILYALAEFVFPAQVAPLGIAMGQVIDLYYLAGIVGCLVTITVSYRRSSTLRERQQMRLLMGGVALALIPVLLLTVLPTTLNLPTQDIVDARISALSLGLLPLAMGYSILRYQILIFDRSIQHTVARIIGGMGLALFGFFMLALNNVLSSAHVSFAPVFVTALAMLGALRIALLAKLATNRLFFSEVLHYRHLIDGATTPVDEMLSLDEASRVLTMVASDTFATPCVCFFVADRERKSFRACPPVNDDGHDSARHALVQYLARLEEPVAEIDIAGAVLQRAVVERLAPASRPLLLYELMGAGKERPVGLSRYLKGALPFVGADVLLAPVRAQGQLIGVLVLGQRGDQQTYAGPDFDIVQFLLARYSSLVEMARVTLELRAAYERQKELDRLKDEFIITASHELRTPLTAVQGYIELLHNFDQELPAETREEFLKTACHSVDELTLMVDNIMQVAQAGMGHQQITVSRAPLAEKILQTVEMFEAMFQREKRVLQVDIPASIHVLADDFCLRQVMSNLIGNALKYSSPGTKVEIRAEHSGEQVTVCIRDYGLGVPPQDQTRLFERFVRLERDLNSPVRGTGLGLSICKQLVEAMGGRIWVESEGIAGEGSRFAFTLPSAPGSAEQGEKKLVTAA